MIGSFHLVTFRRPWLLPPGRSPGRLEGRRFWTALSTARNQFLAAPPHVSPARFLRPNLREWAFFGVWEDETDVDRFLASSLGRRWADASTELWSVWLKPAYARGDWAGVKALDGLEPDRLPRAPAAYITRLELQLGALGAMWLSAVPRLVPQMPSVPGLLMGVPIMGRPPVQPMTFSIWRSVDEAMSFAYRGPVHPKAVERVGRSRKTPLRFSAARFYPYRSQGTWKGSDPLLSDR
jgi:hypothetical protein